MIHPAVPNKLYVINREKKMSGTLTTDLNFPLKSKVPMSLMVTTYILAGKFHSSFFSDFPLLNFLI